MRRTREIAANGVERFLKIKYEGEDLDDAKGYKNRDSIDKRYRNKL